MAEVSKDPDRNLSLIRDEIDELRRDVLDMRDATALPMRKSASHLAVQTTLAIIALVVLALTAGLLLLQNGRVSDIAASQKYMLEELKGDQSDLAAKHADTIIELEQTVKARNDLARELASVKQELLELRLEAKTGVVSDDRELARLREQHNALQEKAAALEREVSRADALAEQLKAMKEESELRVSELQRTIRELQEKISQMGSVPVLPASIPPTRVYASADPGPVIPTTPPPTPSPTAPKRSTSSAIDDL